MYDRRARTCAWRAPAQLDAPAMGGRTVTRRASCSAGVGARIDGLSCAARRCSNSARTSTSRPNRERAGEPKHVVTKRCTNWRRTSGWPSERGRWGVALGDEVIGIVFLMRPCIFHWWVSTQNKQERIRVTSPPVASRARTSTRWRSSEFSMTRSARLANKNCTGLGQIAGQSSDL